MMLDVAKNSLPVLVLLALCTGCGQNIPNQMIHYGPDVKADIVFYFKKGKTNDQVNYFLDNELAKNDPNGKGHWSLPGIQGDFRFITQGYEGYAITLRKDVSQDECENIMTVIKNSLLVYRVFENAVPDQIILDPVVAKKEKEDLEKVKNDNRPTKRIVVTGNSENK